MCNYCNDVDLHHLHTRRAFGTAVVGLIATNSICASTLCETGRRQSPIDIVETHRRHLPALTFHYRPTPLTLANDGSTVRVRMAAGNTLQIGKQIYALYQFHFHTPGGEAIAGKHYPMVAHMLHKSSTGQLVAVAVHLIAGKHNYVIESVWSHIPARASGDHQISGVNVDVTALLPNQQGYYRYTGSLTAAPCTEGVDWIVLKQPVEISSEQMAFYRHHFPDNMRDLQPSNQRLILESE